MDVKLLKKKFEAAKKPMRKFISDLETAQHRGVLANARAAEAEVWQEVNCLSCANCCKKMTPTLTRADKVRIAAHLGMSEASFTKQYLTFDAEDKDWRMQQQPCVFLDKATNMCSIYEVRPKDCAGFPHLTKTPLKNYLHIHQQNIEYCPATFRFVEKMMDRIAITKI